jgi:hypothetical protein
MTFFAAWKEEGYSSSLCLILMYCEISVSMKISIESRCNWGWSPSDCYMHRDIRTVKNWSRNTSSSEQDIHWGSIILRSFQNPRVTDWQYRSISMEVTSSDTNSWPVDPLLINLPKNYFPPNFDNEAFSALRNEGVSTTCSLVLSFVFFWSTDFQFFSSDDEGESSLHEWKLSLGSHDTGSTSATEYPLVDEGDAYSLHRKVESDSEVRRFILTHSVLFYACKERITYSNDSDPLRPT